MVPALVTAPPVVLVLSVPAVPPLAPPLVSAPPDATAPPEVVTPAPDEPPALDTPPLAASEPADAAPPVPGTPPEPSAPAVEPEPPADESQPWSKIAAPASSRPAHPLAFQIRVGIASSVKSILRIMLAQNQHEE
jgi:hypothetical protein